MDIKLIITNIRPNSMWCLNGNTLDDLVWNQTIQQLNQLYKNV